MPEPSASGPPHESERLFELQQRALEAAGIGLWTWEIDDDRIAWSPVCDELFGVNEEGRPLTFADLLQRVHEDDRLALREAVAVALNGGHVFEHGFRVVRPDGSQRWLLNHGRAERAADGRLLRMLGSVQDVSRQKLVEQRYAESQERMSRAVESSGLGIWTWEVASGEVTWSEQCYRIYGLETRDFAGTLDAFAARVHPEDRDRVLGTLRAAITQRTPYVSEYRIVKPGGEVAWVTHRGSPSRASDGRPSLVVGTIGDVTSLKQTELALHAALSASQTGTFQWNILTNALTWDDELDRLFRLAPGSTVRSLEQFFALVHPDDRAEVATACERCRTEGADFDLEYRVVLPGGGVRWLYDRGVTFRDATGRPASMTGACVDITARVASDRALALNRSRLDYATRLSGVGFWYCDLPFDVLEWDDRVKEHFFFPPNARITITINDFYARIHEEDRTPTRDAIDASVRSGAAYDITYRTVHPTTGAVKWIRALGGTDYASDGTPAYFDGVTVDVSAQKLDQQRLTLLNDQLRQQDRLKDQFIAMLSHELRNPLAPIRAAAKVVASAQVTPAQLQRAQAIIQRQVTNMSLLLDDLLDIARITQHKLTIRKQTVSIADVVDAAVEAVRPSLSEKKHRLAVQLPPDPVSLAADPLRLSQILSNLLTNAAKYSEPGSTIRLNVGADAEMLSLSVEDEGIGIAPESLAGIFEMFSQIDEGSGMSDGGLGIGLALVKGLTELHGGTVEARSAGRHRGSQFIVRLPLPAQTRLPAAMAPVATLASARHKVLIADDNEDAVEAIALVLELAGHDVRVAHSGQDALSLVPLFRPQTVVLDIGMPDLNGYDVARRLRREPWGKELRLIALTGWGQESDRAMALEAGFDLHLTKPVDPEHLERLIGGNLP